MDSMLAVLEFFSPNSLYGIFDTIKSSMLWLSPIFLMAGFGTIVFEQSEKAVSGKPNFQEAAAGTIFPMIFLTMYIFMGTAVYGIAHNVKTATRDTGSFEKMAENYKKTINKLDEKKVENQDWIDKAIKVVEDTFIIPNLLEFVVRLLFLLTFLIVVFVEIAVEFALAVVILFVYAYGFIAMPTINKTKSFSFGEGWWRLFIAMIFYIIISSILFLILEVYIANSSLPTNLKSGETRDFSATRVTLYIIYSFSNVLIITIDIVSVWAAAALSRNQDALMPIMAPIIGAGGMLGKMIGDQTLKGSMKQANSKLKPVASKAISAGMSSLKDSIRNGLGGMGSAMKTASGSDGGGGWNGNNSKNSGGSMNNDYSGGETRGTTGGGGGSDSGGGGGSDSGESNQRYSFENQEAEPETLKSDNENTEIPKKEHPYASAAASFERLKDTSWAKDMDWGDKK